MNLKNSAKENAYVKFILPRTLLPYKSARRNNQAAVTVFEADRQTLFKSHNGFQCNLVDIIFRSGVARFTTSLRQHLSQVPKMVRWWRFREYLASVGRRHGKISDCSNWFNVLLSCISTPPVLSKNTAIHALVTENFQLIGLLLTGGQVHDSECATSLLSNLEGKTVLGDKAFCSARIRNFIQAQGGRVCIPDKTNSRALHEFDRDLYKARNVVERFFLRIKNRRRIATRYDKLAVCFLNFVFLSALMIQL